MSITDVNISLESVMEGQHQTFISQEIPSHPEKSTFLHRKHPRHEIVEVPTSPDIVGRYLSLSKKRGRKRTTPSTALVT